MAQQAEPSNWFLAGFVGVAITVGLVLGLVLPPDAADVVSMVLVLGGGIVCLFAAIRLAWLFRKLKAWEQAHGATG